MHVMSFWNRASYKNARRQIFLTFLKKFSTPKCLHLPTVSEVLSTFNVNTPNYSKLTDVLSSCNGNMKIFNLRYVSCKCIFSYWAPQTSTPPILASCTVNKSIKHRKERERRENRSYILQNWQYPNKQPSLSTIVSLLHPIPNTDNLQTCSFQWSCCVVSEV